MASATGLLDLSPAGSAVGREFLHSPGSGGVHEASGVAAVWLRGPEDPLGPAGASEGSAALGRACHQAPPERESRTASVAQRRAVGVRGGPTCSGEKGDCSKGRWGIWVVRIWSPNQFPSNVTRRTLTSIRRAGRTGRASPGDSLSLLPAPSRSPRHKDLRRI